ncbi:MAG: hypothetical protein ACQGVK_05100 [Myxococcota bacterium]
MFRPSSEAPLLTEAGVMGLCASLNSPVLNIEHLPVGPARAAILLFAGEYGGVRIAVGLRSVETGAVAHFAYAGGADDFDGPDRAMDAALTFAEALGFLFDDDVVTGSGRGEALRVWQELTGEVGSDPVPELELELDTAVDGELLLDDEAATPAPAQPTSATLTKFRQSPAQAGPAGEARRAGRPEPAAETTGGSHLGRIALVRRRVSADGPRSERPGFLMRILSAF